MGVPEEQYIMTKLNEITEKLGSISERIDQLSIDLDTISSNHDISVNNIQKELTSIRKKILVENSENNPDSPVNANEAKSDYRIHIRKDNKDDHPYRIFARYQPWFDQFTVYLEWKEPDVPNSVEIHDKIYVPVENSAITLPLSPNVYMVSWVRMGTGQECLLELYHFLGTKKKYTEKIPGEDDKIYLRDVILHLEQREMNLITYGNLSIIKEHITYDWSRRSDGQGRRIYLYFDLRYQGIYSFIPTIIRMPELILRIHSLESPTSDNIRLKLPTMVLKPMEDAIMYQTSDNDQRMKILFAIFDYKSKTLYYRAEDDTSKLSYYRLEYDNDDNIEWYYPCDIENTVEPELTTDSIQCIDLNTIESFKDDHGKDSFILGKYALRTGELIRLFGKDKNNILKDDIYMVDNIYWYEKISRVAATVHRVDTDDEE